MSAISLRLRMIDRTEISMRSREAMEPLTFACERAAPMTKRLTAKLLGLLALAVLALPLRAEEAPALDAETWRKSQALRSNQAMDAYPVRLQMRDVTYLVPRNYLEYLPPFGPVFRVTWPGLKPLTAETAKCFGSILQSRQAGCTSIRFSLSGSGLSTEQMFENYMKLFPDVHPRQSPLGYDIYDTGPENARNEVHKINRRNASATILYCHVFDNHGKKDATCGDDFSLKDNNTLHFFVSLDQIGFVPEIEDGMRELMENFREAGEQK